MAVRDIKPHFLALIPQFPQRIGPDYVKDHGKININQLVYS